MKENLHWLEYIITVRPGYIYDVEGILKDIKNKHKEFEYVIEKARAQTIKSEYILGITPSNFKLFKEKIYSIFNAGSISPIIVLTLVGKNGDNSIVARIGLDKKDLNVFLTPDILGLNNENIEKELKEINSLFMID